MRDDSMMSLQIPPSGPDYSLPPDLILILSILFGLFYFLVWRTGVMIRGGIDRTESAGQRRVRFKVSSVIVAVWIITIGFLILLIGVLPSPWVSPLTLVLVVLLGLALFDLFRQHSNL
ncbi:MAG: hypothetical protein ACXABY_22115 [Candidatus Thorarchaeota archaeon]